MRTLLLELRPSELTDAKLGDLIRQLAAVIANRTGLTIFTSTWKRKIRYRPMSRLFCIASSRKRSIIW